MSGTWMFVPPRRVRRGAALTFVLAGVLATGFATGSWPENAEGGEPYGAQGAPIRPSNVEGPPYGRPGAPEPNDAHELVSRSGDRWSAAYSAREYEGLRQALDGEYVGVGISVRRAVGGGVEVARVTPDSPAERAGVRSGDRLLTVDDAKAAGSPVTEAVARLRGDDGDGGVAEAGSEVVLGLSRGGRDWHTTLRRALLSTEAVRVERIRPGTTRIAVTAFTKGSGREVREAVRNLPSGTGVVLDLRGNSGGLLHEACATAAAFLDGGLVGTYGEDDAQRALHAEPGGQTSVPLVVLVDGGSMSAAELVAGALQDRDRAVVVGSRTFGKGSVQVPKEQPDGSVAEITVGHYTTPAGRDLEGEGLSPDVGVRPGEKALDKARTVLSGLAARG